ncbi:hypothetical protein B0H13DRAFT_2340303 [Mycena leptocephala]|nr:hypothetical protein B0H13DRAFT_2340303 [Mycena leptocephala]
MNVKLSISTSLPYDLVLGHDWLFFCRETLPHTSFGLSSGICHPGQQPTMSPSHSAQQAPNTAAMDTGTQISANTPSLSALAMSPWLAAVHLHLFLYHLLYHEYNDIFESFA